MERFAVRPTIYFGEGSMAALDALAGRRVLIVTDAFLASSGLLDRVKARLTGAVEVFDKVEPDPSLRLVAQGVAALHAFRPDAVVAFGGGSPMDCAKGMVYFSNTRFSHPPQRSPLEERGGAPGGTGPRPEGAAVERSDACSAEHARALPLWCVPTTAGTGSEVTSFAVLTDTDKGVKYPLVEDALLPEAAILDASLLDGVPPHVTADTGMDVLTHAAEGYVAKGASPFSDALAEKAFTLAYRRLPAAWAGDRGAKADMLLASCLAGMAFNAAGLGVCHSMAHALGGKFHAPHGRLNALLLPGVVNFNAQDRRAEEKYAQLARLCSLAGNPRALAAGLTRLRTGLKIAPRIQVTGAELREAMPGLTTAALADVCLPGNPRTVTAGDLEAMMREIAG